MIFKFNIFLLYFEVPCYSAFTGAVWSHEINSIYRLL